MESGIYKDKVPHGNALFAMAVHVTPAAYRGRDQLYCHWHEEIEFLVVTDGVADFHIDTNSYRVYAGEAIYIPPNKLHSATAVGSEACGFFAVVFSPILLRGFTEDQIELKYIDPIMNSKIWLPEYLRGKSVWESEIIKRLTLIKNLNFQKEAGYELLIKANIFEIWYLMTIHGISSDPAASQSGDYQAVRIKTILNYIHQNYDKTLTSHDISSIFHMSEGHFCRLFKSMVKMSATDYINYYRICKSVSLFENRYRKISDIAGSVGFNSTSYFIKMFRRFMHCTPTEFRRD